MAHGTPDYGVTQGSVTTYQVGDLAELAARLGSPDTWDRRGEIVWFDSFECGLAPWVVTANGTGSSVVLSTTRARHGRRSAQLTAGSDGAASAVIVHLDPRAALSRYGVEFWLSPQSAVGTIQLVLVRLAASVAVTATIKADLAGGTITYTGPGGIEHNIVTGQSWEIDATMFHVFKVVVDANLGQYVRLIVDGVTYDLLGVAALVGAAGAADYFQTGVYYIGRAGHNDQLWVDAVIYTQNEP